MVAVSKKLCIIKAAEIQKIGKGVYGKESMGRLSIAVYIRS
jgi:hypothetical protein